MADDPAQLDVTLGGSLPDATASLSRRATVASPMRTREWEAIAPELREAAFFSAGVENARYLTRARERLQTLLDGARREEGAYQTREKFIAELQAIAREEGLAPDDPALAGSLQDVSSERRLGLIWDMQVRQAQGLADHRAGLKRGALLAFPAQELVRIETRRVPRNWPERWRAAGGRFYGGGRMIALKTDPIWSSISRFGRPWPPFDFGSGMGLRDVSRRNAIALGVMEPTTKVAPPTDAADRLAIEASTKGIHPSTTGKLLRSLGDAYTMDEAAQLITRDPDAIGRFYDRAIADPGFKGRFNLGLARPDAIASLAMIGEDIAGWIMEIFADNLRHAHRRHGLNEAHGRQRAITREDVTRMEAVIRSPNIAGTAIGDAIGLTRNFRDGNIVTVWLRRSYKRMALTLETFWVKKDAGQRLP